MSTKINKPKKTEQKPVVRLIRKANDLVEARYKFDIWETRVFTKMLTLIRQDDADFKEYRIYLKDIISDFGLQSDKAAYQWLKTGALKLGEKTVKILRDTDEGLKEFRTKIVAGTESFVNDEDGKYIDVSFHPRMKPYLLALKSRFTVYDARNILKLPSTYSIRIYELLKQYEKIGKRKFDLQELKEIVGAVEQIEVKGKKTEKDNYPLYGNFRQKVLLKAERDLENYTDIRFEFEALKRGRKVKEIMFYIFPNIPKKKDKKGRGAAKKATPMITPPKSEHPVFAELFPLIQEWVSPQLFEKWLTDYPESQVRNSISYTLNRLKKGEKIENVGGYLFAMVKQTNLFDPIAVKKEKKVQKKEEAAAILTKKATLEQELKSLRQELVNKENAIIEALFLEEPTLEVAIFEATKNNRFSQYDSAKNKEENLADSLFAGAFRNMVRKRFPKRFVAIDARYNGKIKLVKQALQIL